MDLKFTLRVETEDGDHVFIEDWCTFSEDRIDEFGGNEAVDMMVARALRIVKNDVRKMAQEAENRAFYNAEDAAADAADVDDFENRRGIYAETATEFRARINKIISG